MLKFVKLSDAFDIDQLQEESLDVHKQNCKSNQKVEIDQKYSFYNSHEVAPANAYKIPLPNTFKKDFELPSITKKILPKIYSTRKNIDCVLNVKKNMRPIINVS